MTKVYKDERYCDHCEKDTQHGCVDSQHERDSSQDYQECNECGWYMYGLTGEYQEPTD